MPLTWGIEHDDLAVADGREEVKQKCPSNKFEISAFECCCSVHTISQCSCGVPFQHPQSCRPGEPETVQCPEQVWIFLFFCVLVWAVWTISLHGRTHWDTLQQPLQRRPKQELAQRMNGWMYTILGDMAPLDDTEHEHVRTFQLVWGYLLLFFQYCFFSSRVSLNSTF